jgi:Sulfotransferase domain
MPDVLLHVGVAKSGTSFLQQNVFERVTSALRLGQPYADKELRARVESLKRDDDYDFDLPGFQQAFERLSAAAVRQRRKIIFSDETLTSPEMKTVVARRLHSAFDKAKILVTIRNQLTSVESYYVRHGRILKKVPNPWSGRYIKFDDWFGYYFSHERGGHFDRIDYYKIYQIYANIFGAENVHVIMSEAIRAKQNAVVSTLCSLLQCDERVLRNFLDQPAVNARTTSREHSFHRFRSALPWGKSLIGVLPVNTKVKNIIRENVQSVMSGGKSDNFVLPEPARERIFARYANGNRQLVEMLGLDLKRFGYPL